MCAYTFISTPIASFRNETEQIIFNASVRNLCLKLSTARISFFCAAFNVANQGAFDTPKNALIEDIREVQKSTHFILIYPDLLPSGALVELGIALATGIPILLVIPSPSILAKIDLGQSLHNVETHIAVLEDVGLPSKVINWIHSSS